MAPSPIDASVSPDGAAAPGLRRPVELQLGDGAVTAEFYDGRRDRPILFAHANGFCASASRKTLADLSARGGGAVLAIDLRGHGRATLPADPKRHRSWDVFGSDIAAALDSADRTLGLCGPWGLAGHSLGAVSAALCAARLAPRRVSALALVEPVLMPASARWLARTPVWPLFARRMPLVRGALARRGAWAGRAEVLARYEGKPAFSRWAPGVLADYLDHGLAEAAGGGVQLACAPAWEAANFAAQAHDVWSALRRIAARRNAIDVRVLKAASGSTVFPGPMRALTRLGIECALLPDAGHLAPMERPEEVGRFLASALSPR